MGFPIQIGSLGLALLAVLFLCQQAASLQLLQSPSREFSPTPASPGAPSVSEAPCCGTGNFSLWIVSLKGSCWGSTRHFTHSAAVVQTFLCGSDSARGGPARRQACPEQIL